MTDTTSDIVVSRLLKKLHLTEEPDELSALCAEFARHKPPASAKLGDEYVSPEKEVIAKILAQPDKIRALYDLSMLANLGGAQPDETMFNRHSLSVPAAMAWGTLLYTLPGDQVKTITAMDTLHNAQTDVMKEVAASALITSLTQARSLGQLEVFALNEVKIYVYASDNDLLRMQLDNFHHERAQTFIAAQPAPVRT